MAGNKQRESRMWLWPHSSGDCVGVVVGVLQDFADTKVSNLYDAAFAKEYILRLQVSMLQANGRYFQRKRRTFNRWVISVSGYSR